MLPDQVTGAGDTSLVAMSLNLWSEERWPAREPALRRLLTLRPPDLLAVQELTPSTAKVIDDVLVGHDRVHDDLPGWLAASNLWWDRQRYRLLEHGTVPIGGREPLRELFWVRLELRGTVHSVLAATAHFVWSGDAAELTTGHNPRLEQTRRCVAALDELDNGGPCLFMGDLNDAVHPVKILRRAGFQDAATALGGLPQPTHPAVPSGRDHDGWPAFQTPMVLDWQFHRGPIRPRMTEVVDLFAGELAPSDHKPVVTLYALDRDTDRAPQHASDGSTDLP